jgi:signal transduction histidine kinase/ActR/RegA family two-component response regulator
MNSEQRVLLFTPTGRDAELIAGVLREASIECVACESWIALEKQISAGAAAVILAEETLESTGIMRLRMVLKAQPAWSDLPFLLLTGRGANSPAIHSATLEMGNVTLLERPMRVPALVSAARAALRARARQYESRSQLLELHRAAAELRMSDQRLREANARKDEFLATLAHELRNPLAPIRNALHVLRRKKPDPALTPLHDIMDRQVTQLVRLVDDLLELARISRGNIALHFEKLDIASVLRSAIETSRPLIDAARHELRVALPSEPLPVSGDAVRLSQVFANLLNNAAKYTQDAGIITLTAGIDNGAVVVTVEDTGVGIPSGMLDSIFNMFTQVPGTDERAQGGLGIGLTLVKHLVELHGGRIEAHSEGPGKGSRFTVHLELLADNPVTVDVQPEPDRDMRPLPRVLLVDDNRDAADTLAMVLRAQGADVQTLYNAVDVLATLVPHSQVVVVTDLGMPQMDGYELARRIRADPSNAGVHLIALSGWGQEADRTRAEAAGFDAHLIKPADIEALLSLLMSFHTLDGEKRKAVGN